MHPTILVTIIILVCTDRLVLTAENPHVRSDGQIQGVVLLSPPPFEDLDCPSDVVQSWLDRERERAGYPSVSVSVVRDGKLVLALSSGFADVERRVEATPDTPYHVASVTKVFTTSLAALLDEEGTIDLDASLLGYLPEGTRIGSRESEGDTITLRQLASHTSGLPSSVPGDVQAAEGRYALEPELLYRRLREVELLFAPGTSETYSNLGVGLLGHALERATGKPFDALLGERLLAPLGLDTTSVSPAPNLRPAPGYDLRSKRPVVYDYRARLVASGGLVSSARDLARFVALHLGHDPSGLIPPRTVQDGHRAATLADGSLAHTGLGWSLREHPRLGRLVQKNGGRHNAHAWIGFAPDHRVGAVVLVNCGTRSVGEISDGEDGPVDPDALAVWLMERCVGDSIEGSTADLVAGHAKLAPFTDVDWRQGKPFVRVDERWHELLGIDRLSAREIVQFCEAQYGRKARKRFAEDLVEVMAGMGHFPGRRVTLRVADGATGKSRLITNVEMTRANRARVRDAASTRAER